MKNRILAVLLTAAMLLTLLPSAALAEELSQEQCSCVSLCTEGEINFDCPVCGVKSADLGAACDPAETEPDPNPMPEPESAQEQEQEQEQEVVALSASVGYERNGRSYGDRRREGYGLYL